MLAIVAAVACVAAAGLWAIASSIWPARRSLATALAQLHSTARSRMAFVRNHDAEPSLTLTVGRWLARRARSTTLADDQTVSDLQLLGRPLEVHAGAVALSTSAGALIVPAAWAVGSMAGLAVPVLVPAIALPIGAFAGWFVPRLLLHGEAAAARADFRHALGAYLDVMVLLLAAQEGPESSMALAAQAGQGPAFAEIRRAVWRARLSGDPVWDALDELGARLRIAELREVAAAGSLAGESGAAVRQSLTAKARALRQAALAEAETKARQRSQALLGPLVMMGFGFALFVLYALLSSLDFAGG